MESSIAVFYDGKLVYAFHVRYIVYAFYYGKFVHSFHRGKIIYAIQIYTYRSKLILYCFYTYIFDFILHFLYLNGCVGW